MLNAFLVAHCRIYLCRRCRAGRIYHAEPSDRHRATGRSVPWRSSHRSYHRSFIGSCIMGVVNIGGASAAEPGIATAVGTAFAIMLGKGSEVALTLALPIGILGLQIKTVLYIFIVRYVCKNLRPSGGRRKRKTDRCSSLWALGCKLVFIFPVRIFRDPVRI